MKYFLRIFFSAFLIAAFPATSFSLEWKVLHERADTTSLEDARNDVKNKEPELQQLYVLALVCLYEHKEQEAEVAFKRILELSPETFEARWGMAEVLRRKHKKEESEKILENIIKDHPDFSPAYITLGFLRFTQLEFKESVKLAEHVIDQGSKKVDTSNYVRALLIKAGSKGMIAYNGGLFSKVVNGLSVLSSIKKAEKIKPDSPEVYYAKGGFYLIAPKIVGGDMDKAEENYRKAIEKDPLFADAYVRLAEIYKSRGDMEEYDSFLERALEIDPQNELALDVISGECKFICAD